VAALIAALAFYPIVARLLERVKARTTFLLGNYTGLDSAPVADFAVGHFPTEDEVEDLAAFACEGVFPWVVAERFLDTAGHKFWVGGRGVGEAVADTA
jgi:hypothetical protein